MFLPEWRDQETLSHLIHPPKCLPNQHRHLLVPHLLDNRDICCCRGLDASSLLQVDCDCAFYDDAYLRLPSGPDHLPTPPLQDAFPTLHDSLVAAGVVAASTVSCLALFLALMLGNETSVHASFNGSFVLLQGLQLVSQGYNP